MKTPKSCHSKTPKIVEIEAPMSHKKKSTVLKPQEPYKGETLQVYELETHKSYKRNTSTIVSLKRQKCPKTNYGVSSPESHKRNTSNIEGLNSVILQRKSP